MIPTLAGRLQTRSLIVLVIDVPVTVILGVLLNVEASRAAKVGLVIGGLCLLWEMVWHSVQQLRWDKDWPSALAFLIGVPEAVVGKLVLSWLSVLPFHLEWGKYNILFAASWVLGWLLQQGPLRVLFPSWRFEGGRLRARRSLAVKAVTPAAEAASPARERTLVAAGVAADAVAGAVAGAAAGAAGVVALNEASGSANRSAKRSSGTPKPRRTGGSKRPSSSSGSGRSARRTPAVASTGRRRRPWPVIVGVGALIIVFGVFAVIGLGTDQHSGADNTPADVAQAARPVAKAPVAPAGPRAQAWQAPASQQVADTWNMHKLVQPYAVTIPRLRLQQQTQPVGLTAAQTIQEAAQGKIGWYQSTSAPGQTGPAMLLGPLGGGGKSSVLGGLGQLVKGDTVLVTRADSTTVQYVVDKVTKVKSSAFPAAQVYRKSTDSTLRLVGYRGTGASAHDVIVFATATHLLSPKSGP